MRSTEIAFRSSAQPGHHDQIGSGRHAGNRVEATNKRRRIVVGVDGSTSSIDALLWAQRLATDLDAEIDAVIALGVPDELWRPGSLIEWDPAADAARLLAESLQLAFGDAIPAGLRSEVVEGHPAHVLAASQRRSPSCSSSAAVGTAASSAC